MRLRLTTLLIALLTVQLAAAPQLDNASEPHDPVELDPPDGLFAEARRLLEVAPIERFAARLVARKNLIPAELPVPEEIPTGTVSLSVSEQRVPLKEELVTRASWVTNIPQAIDGQFVYHLLVAQLVGPEFRTGHRAWGVAMTRFNGTTYGATISTTAEQAGNHRVLAILYGLSIKTGQVHVLDVAEAGYAVVERE